MVGTLIKIKGNKYGFPDVLGIVIKQSNDLRYWRVLGVENNMWYELRLDNPYIEVLSESR